jgi:glycine dehydrogenase subunit 1
MGPDGMRELGEQILLRSHYCAHLLAQLPNVSAPYFQAPFFGEFVVSFGEGWPPVATINESLLTRRIFAGFDLSKNFPDLPNAALYSVSELHTEADLEMLASALYDTWTTFASRGSA